MDGTCSMNGSRRTVKEIFESKAEGNRRRVRPRLRWMDYVEKDLR
jgi:hypothetical protein